MKQKKRVWWSFNLWEADAFEQYLEEMAAQGWFLESVGGSVMKFHKAEPEKRRYAALLVPESSSLTGADRIRGMGGIPILAKSVFGFHAASS